MTVVNAAAVAARANPDETLHVRETLGPQTGFGPLRQAVLECTPGATDPITVGPVEETLFVLAGRGAVHVAGKSHPLEPEVGLAFAPGAAFALENPGPEPLRLVAVQVLDPEPSAFSRTQGRGPAAPVTVCRLADQALESATAQRQFRIVADPGTGLASATHFVGYIPTDRAPEHFHPYDEVLYVLDGEGLMHAGELEQRVAAGSCIQLPARTVHCLENTGGGPMRVVGVFCPAGSPAEAYYPDKTTPEEEPA